MESEVLFRSAVRGFKRKQVINYIEQIQNEFFSYRKENEKTVMQLNARIAQLEQQLQQEKSKKETREVAEIKKTEKDSCDSVEKSKKTEEKMSRLLEQMLQAGLEKYHELSDDEEESDEEAMNRQIQKIIEKYDL